RYRAVADGVLETAGCVDDIQLAVCVQRDVAEMPRTAKMSAEQMPIDHRRSADAGAERQHESIFAVFRRALPDFAEKRGMGIIQNAHRRSEFLLPLESLQFFEPALHPPDAFPVGADDARRGDAED